jgi:transposase
VKRCAQPVNPDARVIGIDEWAKRKGHTYGTLVVDLERHTVIDVLNRHSTEAVEQWLVAHPDIQMIGPSTIPVSLCHSRCGSRSER